VSVPYAKVSDASEAAGSRLGWADSSFDDKDWPESWLNEEQNTIRKWQIAGPFPNTDNDGFSRKYPPEQEFDLAKRYDGLDAQVSWEEYNGNEPFLDRDSPIEWTKSTLVIIARKDDPLVAPIQFVTGATPFSLKPWTQTALANFSGTAIYTKTFSLPENFSGMRVMLDLGRVSSVADVFVNGEHAGMLVWRPYQLDISKLIKPGENEIRILITNTEANQRAVGTRHRILPAIDVDGMEGPVQLIPYIDRVLTLQALRIPAVGSSPFR
jgi:hypothetical protein